MDNRMNKNIASRLLFLAKEVLGMEFPTQDALDKYLKDHPDADRSNHKVVKTEKKDSDGSDIRDIFHKHLPLGKRGGFYLTQQGKKITVKVTPVNLPSLVKDDMRKKIDDNIDSIVKSLEKKGKKVKEVWDQKDGVTIELE